ncbi:MAG: hypothetical protein ACP5QW_02095, partial [bacterium]
MASFFSSCGSSPPFSTYLSKNKVHPYITSLNFLPGTTLYSGKTIYWVINSDGLVKETYIKWGKDPGHLDHIGKHYFASLYLYKDAINVETDGNYYLEIVARTDNNNEFIYGPYPFFAKASLQATSMLRPTHLRLMQDQKQNERVAFIPGWGAHREEEWKNKWDLTRQSGFPREDKTDIEGHYILDYSGGVCILNYTILDNITGGTISGQGLCDYIGTFGTLGYAPFQWVNKEVESTTSNVAPYIWNGNSYSEEKTINESFLFFLPPPLSNERVKSVKIIPGTEDYFDINTLHWTYGLVPYLVTGGAVTEYVLGGQVPSEPNSAVCPDMLSWDISLWGSSYERGFLQPPCYATLIWDVTALAPTTSGGLYTLDFKGPLGEPPVVYEDTITINNPSQYEQRKRKENSIIYAALFDMPYEYVIYNCVKSYTITLEGLYENNVINPTIPPNNLSTLELFGRLTSVCGSNVDLSNKTLKFEVKRVESGREIDNGGHFHDHSTNVVNIGYFDSSTCITDSNGWCSVLYTLPQTGGLYEMTVSLESDPDVVYSVRFMVGVEGLTSLVPSSYYRLTGQTQSHPDNHWAMEDVIGYIQQMASDYYTYYNAILGINDMSLIFGGLFDYQANWDSVPGHKLHRLGRSVDIDTCAQSTIDPKAKDPYCQNRKYPYPDGYVQVDKDAIGYLCQKY